MIVKPALAAMMASGLAMPEAPKLILPKPAIIKAENIEFSKNLLAMPLTLGMLPGKAIPGNITFLGSATLFTFDASLSFTFINPNNKTIVVAWAVGVTSSSSDPGQTVTIGGSNATLIGKDFSYTGMTSNVQISIGFSYRTSPGTSGTVVVTTLAASSNRAFTSLAVWSVDAYTTFTKTGFNRNNAATLSSSITAAANTHLIGYSAWKNSNVTNGYYHGAATMKVTSALSAATVTGTLGSTGRDWSGTAGITEMLETVIGSTGSTNTNRTQTFCICS